MNGQCSVLGIVLLTAWLTVTAGCRPQQPFFFFEDGDLSHYIGAATEIEYPDLDTASLEEVNGAMPPLTLESSEPKDTWDLPLEEAMQIALSNSKVIRNLGGVAFGPTGAQGEPSSLTSQPQFAATVYNPAIEESNPRFGVEAALAAFDAQFTSSVFWEKNDTPQNVAGFVQQFRPRVFQQDLGTFQARLAKTAATGGTWSLTHNVGYELNNLPANLKAFPSAWTANLEAEFRQPFLQGNGVQFNRIAGPGSIPGFNNGVMIARLRTDTSLADFEAAVRNLVSDVERTYWNLYFAYRSLDAAVVGRDAMLGLWREQKVKFEVGTANLAEEAQARQQYFVFRAAVEHALSNLYETENHLRYMMGLSPTDGRLIRPSDEPTTARVDFDWYEAHAEALTRSVELRKQKWQVKQRELELIAAKNYLLPRLDMVGRYRWLGLGDRLIDSDNSVSNAYGDMTSGNQQEWHLGFELSIPIGFRKEMAGVRHAQLNLARERAVLQEQELELIHQLSHAFRRLAYHYQLSQTNFNRRVAALNEAETTEIQFKYGYGVGADKFGPLSITFAQVLDAKRRLAEAEIQYYRALVDYNLAITELHLRKGSLLEYNGVHLAEGPWPGKAYFDAQRRARGRDASMYLDYGFTRPKVISRGRYHQHAGAESPLLDIEPGYPTEVPPEAEIIPTPDPLPMKGSPLPDTPPEGEANAVQGTSDGPRLTGLPSAEPDSQAASGSEGKRHELGKMDLDVPAAKAENAQPTPNAGMSPVQRVSYQQPESSAGTGKPSRSVNVWKSAKRLDTADESVANRSSVKADRTSSGWKGVQH